MKRLSAGLVVAALTLVLPMVSAQAQNMGGGGHRHQQKADKTAEQKPKADEKAYAAALNSLPDKKSDPWHGMR